MIYIHYGSDHFYPECFRSIRNSTDFRPKPAEGTGLWASRENDKFGWEWWCRDNHFNLEKLKESFRFMLPDAKILILETPDQLISLPKLHPWKPKEPPRVEVGELPTEEQLWEWFTPNWCYLDFEKLSEEYDAIELRNSGAFNDSLGTWDCDCILVMRADMIVEINKDGNQQRIFC